MDRNLKMTDINFDKICILFNFSQEPDPSILSNIEKKINFISESIRENNNISITTSMGNSYRNLLDISRSYNEANETLDSTILFNDKSIYWFEYMKKDTQNMYYYPIDMEIRLLNAIKNGEKDEAKRILTQIFEQNFDNRDLSIDMAQQFLLEVKATVLKTFDSKVFQNRAETEQLKDRVTAIQLSDGLEQVIDTLNNVISSFCVLLVNRKREADNDTIKIITEYIEENYENPNLSLILVSEQVGRPEKYISQIFKEQTGEYYAEYIEKIRMHKAVELLVNTNKTIEEISQQVGYNSPHSFRRAFKRFTNVTPNMYRKTLKHKFPS
jgi:two-component system, response regulator YesN